MDIPGTSIPVDFSNPTTRIVAAALGIGGVFVLMKGKKQQAESVKVAPVAATLSPAKGVQWNDVITPPDQRGVIGQVGTYPVSGPAGTNGATGATGATGAPGKPAVIPLPVPTPSAKPYFCPAGSVMAKERGNTANDVCQRPDGSQFQVTYSSDPAHRYPVDPTTASTVPGGVTGWTHITAGGRGGYVSSQYLCGTKICNTGGIGVNVRDRAGLQGAILFALSEGAAVTVGGAGEGPPPRLSPWGGIGGFSTTPVYPKTGKYVTVKPGDSYMSLASQHYGSDDQWGQITGLNPGSALLRVGDKVRVY